jgi:hypothetical protein
MDEISPVVSPWEKEEIPDIDFVLRQVPVINTGPSGRRVPNETAFKLRPGENGLSVNWEKYLDIKHNYILLGITFNKINTFIDYTAFKIFRLEVGYIRSISGVTDVLHDPVFRGDPSPVGQPNNQAHSLIICNDDEEVRIKLADYCRQNFDISDCKFNISSLRTEIEKLRQRLNETRS